MFVRAELVDGLEGATHPDERAKSRTHRHAGDAEGTRGGEDEVQVHYPSWASSKRPKRLQLRRALAAGAFALGAAAIGALAAERFDNAFHLQKDARLIADRTGLAVQNL